MLWGIVIFIKINIMAIYFNQIYPLQPGICILTVWKEHTWRLCLLRFRMNLSNLVYSVIA
jgi:hypothetical protein